MNNIDIKKLIDELETSVKACQNETQIIEAKNIFLKNTVNPLYSKIKTLPDSEKSEYGKNLNLLKEKVNSLVEEYLSSILQEKEKKEHKVDYDIELNSTNLTKGSVSPITLVFRQILSYFQKLNFTIQSGEEVMDAKYNFDHLNIPVTHPTREPSETFYLNEEKTLSLRTQNTASSAQFIDNFKGDEIRVANFGYVYRNDDDDPTHSHQFNQIDFIWVKKTPMSVKNLKWVIEGFVKHVFGEQTQTRFRLSNFAFTEPSFEVDASCPFCGGKGCTRCKHSGWMELLGAGIMHENVMKASNLKGYHGIAAGLGVERIAMLKYGISDLRDIYTNDFRFIKQFAKEKEE